MLGDYLYVGLSTRTNEPGADQLSDIASRQGLWTVTVDVGPALHLKSAVNALDEHTVLVAPGQIDESKLADVDIVRPAAGEEWAVNVLALADRSVLIPAGATGTEAIVERAGYLARSTSRNSPRRTAGSPACRCGIEGGTMKQAHG